MPSFSDSIFLFILALLLFGPKRLPVLARELGKWVGEFRRASNEFKMQMEDELRQSEQTERQKQISAMEAAAPVAPALPETTEHVPGTAAEASTSSDLPPAESTSAPEETTPPEPATAPLPIATSGDLSMMPPSTGLPTPRSPKNGAAHDSALGSLLQSIPEAADHEANAHEAPTETTAHGN